MHLVSFPSDNKPEWFASRLKALPSSLETPWTWRWNETYPYKVSIRNGMVNLVFNDEQEYTWFILKEL